MLGEAGDFVINLIPRGDIWQNLLAQDILDHAGSIWVVFAHFASHRNPLNSVFTGDRRKGRRARHCHNIHQRHLSATWAAHHGGIEEIRRQLAFGQLHINRATA